MVRSILVDAGPLIALFDKDDTYHTRVLSFLKDYSGKLITTWPVITEASHMLSFNVNVQIDFLTWLCQDAVVILNIEDEHIEQLIELFNKYSDVPMDLADGSLLIVSEITGIRDIATIDSDYYVYRLKDKKPLNNVLIPFMNS